MKINCAGIIKESFVDGQGVRYAVFVQGCPHHCEGCHNPQTWEFKTVSERDIDDIVADIESDALLDGATFSGGEPFEQAEALSELAKRIRGLGLTVWTYSGYTFEQLLNDNERRKLLDNIDVLVDGRFVLALRDINLQFKGSSNQRIIDVKKSLEEERVVLWQS